MEFFKGNNSGINGGGFETLSKTRRIFATTLYMANLSILFLLVTTTVEEYFNPLITNDMPSAALGLAVGTLLWTIFGTPILAVLSALLAFVSKKSFRLYVLIPLCIVTTGSGFMAPWLHFLVLPIFIWYLLGLSWDFTQIRYKVLALILSFVFVTSTVNGLSVVIEISTRYLDHQQLSLLRL